VWFVRTFRKNFVCGSYSERGAVFLEPLNFRCRFIAAA
jgi:hypothetical protein